MKQEVHCDGGQPKPGFATSLVRLRGKLVEDMFHNQFFFLYGLWYGKILSLQKFVGFCPRKIL